MLAAILVWAGTACSASSSLGAEEGRWHLFCNSFATQGTTAELLDAEFVLPPPTNSFDTYLMTKPAEELPAPIRADLLSLRQAIADFRAGRISAEKAKASGASGRRAVEDQWSTGACSEFRRRGS